MTRVKGIEVLGFDQEDKKDVMKIKIKDEVN